MFFRYGFNPRFLSFNNFALKRRREFVSKERICFSIEFGLVFAGVKRVLGGVL